jgi:hypothetical protein
MFRRCMVRPCFAAALTLFAAACQLPPEGAPRPAPPGDDARPPADASGADAARADAASGADATPDAWPDGAPGPADASAPPDGGPAPAAPFTIVVLPDTQFYSQSWGNVFDAQTKWIVDNKSAEQIAFVLHTGDIVDADLPEQWHNAMHSLAMLDGNVPYVVTAGNHDYSQIADRVGMTSQFLPVSHFAQMPTFGGTFEPEHIENSYSLFPAGGTSWLVLALEFGPRDEVLDWALATLRRFPTLPAIIITHAYMYAGDRRYDRRGPRQEWNPHAYVMMDRPGSSINDGEEMWRKLVLPSSNVKFVFSGHVVGNGSGDLGYAAARLTSRRPDGTFVHQILANYQYCLGGPCEAVHGGNGFLRLVRISPAERTVSVKTYSPYLDQSQTDDANQFTLDLP